MATLTICGLDEGTMARLRMRAARHGRSIESEVQAILHDVLVPPATAGGLGTRIRERFAGLGELELPPRDDPASGRSQSAIRSPGLCGESASCCYQ
jgi:antitoxin FitA